MGNNPKWLKRRVRDRMKKTGEKYTTALRAIQKELEEESETVETGVATSRGYCYSCPNPIEIGDEWRRERVGNSVPQSFRLVHHPRCPSKEFENDGSR